jgi:probable addiction module antidote protein
MPGIFKDSIRNPTEDEASDLAADAVARARAISGDETMTVVYTPSDASDYLDNEAVIAEYLCAAVEDPNPAVFLAALGDVARQRGMKPDSGRLGPERAGAFRGTSG